MTSVGMPSLPGVFPAGRMSIALLNSLIKEFVFQLFRVDFRQLTHVTPRLRLKDICKREWKELDIDAHRWEETVMDGASGGKS